MLYGHENGIGFEKITQNDLHKLLWLKKDSWETTHNISIVNEENQITWYNELCKEDIHTPKNLVLIAATMRKELFKAMDAIGIFKFSDIDWRNSKANVAWDVFKIYRGKGLGKKLVQAGVGFASDVLNLRKLNAEILENNPASMKCALSAGFEQEGVKEEEVFRVNKYINSHMMGLIISRQQH